MTLPPFLVAAALLFWGWQGGNIALAAPLALLVEAPRWVRLRFALEDADYARIADLCSVFFVGSAVVLAANRGVAHGVIGAVQWLPAILSPVLLAQRLGPSDRVPLTALFRYLRKMKQRDPQLKVPMIDTAGVYVALCVIAAGVGNPQARGYYAGAALLAAWALYALRPRHASFAAWALLFAAGAGLGYGGQLGAIELQTRIGEWIAEWHMRRVESDPARGMTDIGTIGRLKLRDTIVARVYGTPQDVAHARLLHRVSYNAYVGTTWVGRRSTRGDLQAGEGGATWTLAPDKGDRRVRIAQRVDQRRMLLALPSGVTRVTGLAVTEATRTGLGVLQAAAEGDWIQYGAEFGPAIAYYDPPAQDDDQVPVQERETFSSIAQELGLSGMPPEQAVRRVLQHLSGYAYSLWRETPPLAGVTPLADFMTRTKSGHCEYFAASAVLLLRAAGIPARYATGYTALEYSALEGAYVVRARHAHAWTRAWVDGRWIDLDPTPPDWFGEETSRLAPAWEKVADFLRWAAYRWSQREELQASDAWWAVLAVLVAILGWRVLRGKRVLRGSSMTAVRIRNYPGTDSEFYELVKALPPCGAGETLTAWLGRVAPGKYGEELRLHLRYRFDPRGLSAGERMQLRQLCSTGNATT